MIDRKEVLRYLGYKGHEPEQDVLDLIEACIKEVEAAAEPRHVMRRMAVQADVAGAEVFIETLGNLDSMPIPNQFGYGRCTNLTLHSKSLARNLSGCKEAVFFAATLGIGVDRLLNKYLKIQVSKAVVIQAVAAAMIEAYCDKCQDELSEKCLKQGLEVRPRYSPGYGDLSLSVQRDFLDLVQAVKNIGITLTEGDIMLPEKSVTAIMGLRGVL